MFRFFMRVFGCPMRGIEAQKLHNYFLANGGVSSSLEKADIHAVFSCSIIKATDKVTLEYLRECVGLKNRLIVFGCSPVLSEDAIREFFDGEMLATKDLENVDSLFPDFKIKFSEVKLPMDNHPDLEFGKVYLKQYEAYSNKSIFRKRKEPKIIITSKGCSNACSYCSVRKALGPLKSYPQQQILDSYSEAVQKGYKLFIFHGDDTAAFVNDQGNGFDELLYAITEIPGPKDIKWVIDDLHPQWLIKYHECFKNFIEKGVIVELVVPLQAATNRLLKLMRRKHSIDDVLPILEKFRSISGKLKLTTHFIVGFPSETEEDINALKALIDMNLFDHFVLLRYYESGQAFSHSLEPKIGKEQTQKNMVMLKEYIQGKGKICQMTDYE